MKRELLRRLKSLSDADLYKEVYTDPLTGALNRRAFDLRDGGYLALLDLDSLKYINDTLGYRWGDKFLKRTAGCLMTVFGDDSVYRLGGDEFVVVSKEICGFTRKMMDLQSVLPVFSFGIAASMGIADKKLKEQKKAREAKGLRASTGQVPPWIGSVLCTA